MPNEIKVAGFEKLESTKRSSEPIKDFIRIEAEKSKKIHQFSNVVDHKFHEYPIKLIENLNKAHSVLEKIRNEPQTPKSIENFNILAEQFNEYFLSRSAAKLDAIKKLQLPQKIVLLKETHDQSESSSSIEKLVKLAKTVGIGYLALSSSTVDSVSARPTNALAEISRNSSLEQPRYLDQLHLSKAQVPEYQHLVHRELSDIPSNYGLVSQTDLATVYVANKNDTTDINVAKAIAQAIGPDNAALSDIFGRIKPEGLPYSVVISQDTSDAYHYGCSATEFFVQADAKMGPFYNAAEMVEVYEATINNGWNCTMANGETLSQTLAAELHPEAGAAYLRNDQLNWWDQGASDYVSTNKATDRDFIANGCGTLFLGYLHDKLGYDWKTIVAAGDTTLAGTYSKLTGKDSSTAFPNFKKALKPFVFLSMLFPPKLGESWTSQAQKLEAKIIGGSVGTGIAILALGCSGASLLHCIYQQRALREANPQQQQIELDVINADTADPV